MQKNLLVIVLLASFTPLLFGQKHKGDGLTGESCLAYQIVSGVSMIGAVGVSVGAVVAGIDLGNKDKELQKVKEEVKNLRIENQRLITLKNTAVEAVKTLGTFIDSQDVVIADLITKNQNLIDEIRSLKELIEELRKDNNRWLQEVTKLVSEVIELNLQIGILKVEGEKNQMTILMLKEVNNILSSLINTMEEETKELIDTIVSLNKVIDDLNKKIGDKNNIIIEFEIETIRLNGIIEMRNVKIGNLTNWVNKLQNRIAALDIEVKTERLLRTMDEAILDRSSKQLNETNALARKQKLTIAVREISNIFLYASHGIEPLLEENRPHVNHASHKRT